MDDNIRMPFGPPHCTHREDRIWVETSPKTFNHPKKLWTGYWRRFNTIVIPLQSAESYFTDALAAAREAETREELENLLAAKYKERVNELSRAVHAMRWHPSHKLSAHARRASIWAGDEPCLENFAELFYTGIVAAEKDRDSVEVAPKPEVFDDANMPTEQQPLSPLDWLWDERLEETQEGYTWTRNIRELGDDEPSDRATPPRHIFREQCNQSMDGNWGMGGQDVGNEQTAEDIEPTAEDIELLRSMGVECYVHKEGAGDETSADVKRIESRESASKSPVATQSESQLQHAVPRPDSTTTTPDPKTAPSSSSSATLSPDPATRTPESLSISKGAGQSVWATRGPATREETRAAVANLEDVAESGSTAVMDVRSGKPASLPATPTASSDATIATAAEDTVGDIASCRRLAGDGAGANRKRRRSEDAAGEYQDDGSARLRRKRQVLGDGRLEGKSE